MEFLQNSEESNLQIFVFSDNFSSSQDNNRSKLIEDKF